MEGYITWEDLESEILTLNDKCMQSEKKMESLQSTGITPEQQIKSKICPLIWVEKFVYSGVQNCPSRI